MPIIGVIDSQKSGHLYSNSYEYITSTLVGAGGASSVTFNSIPSTYTHLQLRVFGQTNRATYGFDSMYVELNGVTPKAVTVEPSP